MIRKERYDITISNEDHMNKGQKLNTVYWKTHNNFNEGGGARRGKLIENMDGNLRREKEKTVGKRE